MLRFSVYTAYYDGINEGLIERNLIVLKDTDTNLIVAWTDLHKYATSRKSRRRDTGRKKEFLIIVKLLNYCFFDEYGIKSVDQMTSDMVKEFLTRYSLGTLPDDTSDTFRNRQTIDRAVDQVIRYCKRYKDKNSASDLNLQDLYAVEERYDRHKHRAVKVKRLAIEITYPEDAKRPKIFRDMPMSVFQVMFGIIFEKHKNLLMVVALSAFAGLRPSEACNVRRVDSPYGPGLRFRTVNGEITDVEIDISQKLRLRSDNVDVGGIKKPRIQLVYPAFLSIFCQCYDTYMDWITGRSYEGDYGPLSINESGKALTYDAYAARFKSVIADTICALETSDDPEQAMYAQMLKESRYGMHVFRHFFSSRIAVDGATVAELMYWRGDKSPESALTYLQDKGDLEKELKKVSTKALEYQLWKASKT